MRTYWNLHTGLGLAGLAVWCLGGVVSGITQTTFGFRPGLFCSSLGLGLLTLSLLPLSRQIIFRLLVAGFSLVLVVLWLDISTSPLLTTFGAKLSYFLAEVL